MLTTLLWGCSPAVTAITYRPIATISPLLLVPSQLMACLPGLKTVSSAIQLTTNTVDLNTDVCRLVQDKINIGMSITAITLR